MREELEEARERYFWGVVLRATWTSLVLATVVGVLWALTRRLGWSGHLPLAALGLATGVSLAVGAAGSSRGRELAGVLLGALTLPLAAVHLAGASARGEAAFAAESARLVPFLVHAAGALLGGAAVARIWRGAPAPPRAAPAEPGAGEGGAAAREVAP